MSRVTAISEAWETFSEPKNQLWLTRDQHRWSETFALLGEWLAGWSAGAEKWAEIKKRPWLRRSLLGSVSWGSAHTGCVPEAANVVPLCWEPNLVAEESPMWYWFWRHEGCKSGFSKVTKFTEWISLYRRGGGLIEWLTGCSQAVSTMAAYEDPRIQ